MDCCRHYQGLNDMFNSRAAEAQVKKYRKNGLDRAALLFADCVAGSVNLTGASVLDVGGGLGLIHQELLKRGAARALDVELASAFLTPAQALAESLGTRERVEYRAADFAREADDIPPADVVLLNRVLCCYPDMPPLVRAAARHTRLILAISVPRSAWYVRWFGKLANALMRLAGSRFRFYVHGEAAIASLLVEEGLALLRQVSAWPWRISIYTTGPGAT